MVVSPPVLLIAVCRQHSYLEVSGIQDKISDKHNKATSSVSMIPSPRPKAGMTPDELVAKVNSSIDGLPSIEKKNSGITPFLAGAVARSIRPDNKIRHRTVYHSVMAVVFVVVKLNNPAYIERKFLSGKNDVLLYPPMEHRYALEQGAHLPPKKAMTRSEAGKIRSALTPTVAISRKKGVIAIVDMEAIEEIQRREQCRTTDIDDSPLSDRLTSMENIVTVVRSASMRFLNLRDGQVKEVISDGSDGVPKGWMTITCERKQGSSKGDNDKYFLSPGLKEFRSKKEIAAFTAMRENLPKRYRRDEDVAYSLFKIRINQERSKIAGVRAEGLKNRPTKRSKN